MQVTRLSLCGGVLKLPTIPLRQGLSLNLGLPQLCLMPTPSTVALLCSERGYKCSEEPHLVQQVLECALCPWLQSEQPYLPSLSFSPRCRGAFCPSCVCLEVFEPGSHNVARVGLRCLFWCSQDPAVPSCPKAP